MTRTKLSPENAKVFAQAPSEALRPFIKQFVVVEFPFDRKLKLLPDTNLIAELRFKWGVMARGVPAQ